MIALSPRMLQCARAYAVAGDQRAAAFYLGMSYSAFKTCLSRAYERLDVNGAVQFYRALGWLRLP